MVTAFRPVIGRPHPIREITLIPSGGGRFEVTIDGELIYSKAATHQHTTNDFIREQVRQRLGP